MFTRLTGEETCEVQLCTGREEAIAMLREQFLLSDCEQEAFYPLFAFPSMLGKGGGTSWN
ncbi:hypothetical protein ABEO75_30930, partial [Paenibacillus macerans]